VLVGAEALPVQVLASDLCGRFSGRIVRNVDPSAKTPAWMVDRLARCGQRPVTALVAVSAAYPFQGSRCTLAVSMTQSAGYRTCSEALARALVLASASSFGCSFIAARVANSAVRAA